MKIYVSRPARRSIKKIPLPWRERIAKAIDLLAEHPFYGVKMTGEFDGQRKIRVWPYRILYRVDTKKKRVIILAIGHRGGMGYK